MSAVVRRALYRIGYMVRETGQAMDRVGCAMQGNSAYREALFASRHRQIMNLVDQKPIVPSTVKFIAPNASVIGDVKLGADSSVWYGAVVRGDVNKVVIGERTNVQDRAVIHVASGGGREERAAPTVLGDDVTVAHNAVLHACTVDDGAVIGIGAIVLDHCHVGQGAVVAAGAVVTPGTRVGAGELWAGTPAKLLRAVTPEERAQFVTQAANYVRLAAMHAEECGKTPDQLDAERVARELKEERSEDYMSHLGLLGKEEMVSKAQQSYLRREQERQRQVGAQ